MAGAALPVFRMRVAAAVAIVALALGMVSAVAPSAQADEGHTLSGKVWLPSGANALWWFGISVTVEGPDSQTVAVNPADGTFSITGLPSGEYTLKASGSVFSVSGSTYIANVVPEYYGGSYTAGAPITIADDDVAGLDIDLDRGGILRGDAYLPGGWDSAIYQGVLITGDGPGGVTYATTPAADGSFLLFGLAPGNYSFRAQAQAFAGNPAPKLVTTYFPENYEHASPLSIPVSTNDVGQYWAFAIPEAHTISGTVDIEGSTTSELLAGVTVVAYGGPYDEPPWATVDPATGAWSIGNLPAYSFQVKFSGPGLVTQWYDGALDQDSSTLVEPWLGDVTGIDASMARTRSISGAVTLPPGADEDWYQGIRVRLFDSSGSELTNTGVGALTESYSFPNLAPGSYKVKFEVQPYFDFDAGVLVQPNLLTEWFENASSSSTAAVIDITSGSRADVDAALAGGLTISGTATYPPGTSDAAKSASFVYVPFDGDYRYGVFDVASGTYSITGLTPGAYTLHFGDNGVFDPETAEYLPTGLFPWVGGSSTWSSTADVTLTSTGATVNVEYRPGARITGHVTLDPAVPANWLAGVFVEFSGDNGVSRVRVDPVTGNYASTLLPPGDYAVKFDSEPQPIAEPPGYVWPNLVSEYYDDARFVGDAAEVSLGTTNAAGIDAHLAAGRTIAGRVTIPDGMPPEVYEGMTVYATDADDNVWTSRVGDSGEYSFRGLAPGVYTLQFYSGDYNNGFENVPSGLINEYYNDATVLADADPVDITAADATHVDASLELGGWISGHITLPDGADPDWYRGITVTAHQNARIVYGTVSPGGDFMLAGLPVGNWKVQFTVGEYFDDDAHTVQTPDLASIYYLNAMSEVDATEITSTTSGASGKNVTMPSGGQAFTYTPTPTIAGVAAYGNTLTPTTGAWLPTPDSIDFQWSRDGVPIPGATDWLYTVGDSDLGHVLTVTVTAHRAGFVTQSKTSAGVTVAPASPFSAAPTPTITGTKLKGAVLTAKPNTWIPTPTALAYQWYRSGSPISGATKSTYTLTASDATKTITVKVTGSKGGYVSTAKTSAGLAMPKFFTTAPTPAISGTLKSGYTLTAKAGTWSPKPSGIKYQWYRNGTAISKATKSTYKLTTADRGKSVTVRVTGTLSGYGTVTTTSAGKAVPKVFSKTPKPTITGTAKSGKTLTAHRGTWSPTPSYSYQWYRSGAKISGATKSTYKLTSKDKGKKITVKVTGKKTGYLTVTKTSAAKTVSK